MPWNKQGLVFAPHNDSSWMVSHASNPVAEKLSENAARIYFSTRDAFNRSSIATLDLELTDPTRPKNIASAPTLSPGPRGAFDDSGLSMGCIVQKGDLRFLYYLGWNLGQTVPFRNSIGLAISQNGAPFEKFSPAPILDRSSVDPYCLSYPWVLEDSGTWHMWYGSHLEWGRLHGEMRHVIKHASSPDGVHWTPSNHTAIDLQSGDWGVSRPCVLKEEGRFKMWFSRRQKEYRLGYAESEDGKNWVRLDDRAGIQTSASGWDSESVSYPFVFSQNQHRYLLYCGNGYGRTGFGLATWEEK